MLKAGSENAGGQDCGEKGKYRRLPLKTCFGWRFFVKRPVLKTSAGRAAAKKESTAGFRETRWFDRAVLSGSVAIGVHPLSADFCRIACVVFVSLLKHPCLQ